MKTSAYSPSLSLSWSPQSVLAGYLIGTGHFFTGAVTFITAEVLKLTLGERLFHLKSNEAVVDPRFRVGLPMLATRDGRRGIIGSVEVSRQLAHMTGQFFRSRWLHFKAARRQPRNYGRAVFVANGSVITLSLWTGAQAVFSLTAT
jgi:hypothetical protein